jgi:hypothetical protein
MSVAAAISGGSRMPKQTDFKPQMEEKHPQPWRDDLNPARMDGQNIGAASSQQERRTRTAYDVKDVHRALRDFNDDELQQIPILEAGTALQIGATYLDLDQGPFTVSTKMLVGREQKIVPKDSVHYETWNRLVGEEKS